MAPFKNHHPLALSAPPSILRMSGMSVHGLRGRERYRLDRFWCLNLFQGDGELQIGDQVFPFHHGWAGITWPGVEVLYAFHSRTIKTWVHFVPAAAENAVDVPVMQDLGGEFESVRSEIERVSILYQIEPVRAVARLWTLLWRLVPESGAGSETETGNLLVKRAVAAIEQAFTERFEIRDLARNLGVSQTHLNRVFRSSFGVTVGEWVRTKRLTRARDLLISTTLPIKSIAHQIGIPDVHHFNKCIRRRFGHSPSDIRRGSDGRQTVPGGENSMQSA